MFYMAAGQAAAATTLDHKFCGGRPDCCAIQGAVDAVSGIIDQYRRSRNTTMLDRLVNQTTAIDARMWNRQGFIDRSPNSPLQRALLTPRA